jgi:hypothetical protein
MAEETTGRRRTGLACFFGTAVGLERAGLGQQDMALSRRDEIQFVLHSVGINGKRSGPRTTPAVMPSLSDELRQ